MKMSTDIYDISDSQDKTEHKNIIDTDAVFSWAILVGFATIVLYSAFF